MLQMMAEFLAADRGRRGRRWRSTPSPRSVRAATSSAPPTRWRATRPPSTRRSSPTGATSRPGARPAPPDAAQRPTRSGSSSWPTTSRRRSTRRSPRSSSLRRQAQGGRRGPDGLLSAPAAATAGIPTLVAELPSQATASNDAAFRRLFSQHSAVTHSSRRAGPADAKRLWRSCRSLAWSPKAIGGRCAREPRRRGSWRSLLVTTRATS